MWRSFGQRKKEATHLVDTYWILIKEKKNDCDDHKSGRTTPLLNYEKGGDHISNLKWIRRPKPPQSSIFAFTKIPFCHNLNKKKELVRPNICLLQCSLRSSIQRKAHFPWMNWLWFQTTLIEFLMNKRKPNLIGLYSDLIRLKLRRWNRPLLFFLTGWN